MSYDRKLDHVCPHLVSEEALFFNPDRLTIQPLRPISNIQSVKVRLNGVTEVPSSGVHIPAKIKGTIPGPFSISSGVNDSLVVSINAGSERTVTIPSGRQVTSIEMAKILTSLIPEMSFSVTKKNQIQGRTRAIGKGARILLRPTSTAAATFGFSTNRVYRGAQPFPRWSLVNDPNTLSVRPSRLIVFDEQINGTNDYAEINYSTIRQECRRCGGSGVEHDWRYNRFGELVKVRDGELLIQELLKITYTTKGTNPFHLWYGTGLLESIGKKLSAGGVTQNLIISDVQDAFRRWQSIKKQQEEDVGQFVSDEEYPFRLLVVNLEQDTEDPTIVYVNSLVQSRSTQPIQVSRGLKLPVPLDILGSTVQDALLAQNT